MSSHTAEIPIEARSHRRLLASVKVRDQVSHPLRRDSGRSSNRNRHLSPSVNTSRLIVTYRLQIAKTKQRDGSGPGARGRLGGPR